GGTRSLRCADLHKVVVKRSTGADVGERLRCCFVRVGAVLRQLSPPYRRSRYDSWPHAVADDGFGVECSTLVEDGHALAGVDAAKARVVDVNLERRLSGGTPQRRDVDETRIEKRV